MSRAFAGLGTGETVALGTGPEGLHLHLVTGDTDEFSLRAVDAEGRPAGRIEIGLRTQGALRRGGLRLPGDGRTPGAVAMVTWIEVSRTHRRHGVATWLYEQAAKAACRLWHAPLSSDFVRAEGAEGFWRKQASHGRARCIQRPNVRGKDYGCSRYELSCPAPASLAGLRRRR